MKVHIYTKQNKAGFVEDLYTQEDRIRFADTLLERLAKEDFDAALVTEDGDGAMFGNLHELVATLKLVNQHGLRKVLIMNSEGSIRL